MLSDDSKDQEFLASFLYYFGVLTPEGERPDGKLALRVPNLVMRGLYTNRLQRMLLPEPLERDEGKAAAELLHTKADMAPLCDFVENRFFAVFRNPDYRWANELTVKTAFPTLLYNDILYVMDSEKEAGRGCADLVMIVRPDMRRFEIFDVLVEFKFAKLGEVGLTGQEAGKLESERLRSLPAIAAGMKKAKEQVEQHGDALEQKYKNLNLKRYAVVSLGFERICWEEIRK